MISTKSVEESKGFVSNWIKPGIGEYKIVYIEHVNPEMGSEHIKLYMESKPLDELNGEPQKGEFSLYVTEKAAKYTLSQIQAIAQASGTPKEELDKIEAPDWGTYVSKISALITGKFLRFKFRGEEVLSKTTGNKWLKAALPTYKFVEPLTDVVGLVFDPEKDIKLLPDPDAEDMVASPSNSMKEDDDLPF